MRSMDWNAADQKAWREKELIYAGALAIRPPCIISLNFRPEEAINAALESRVEGQGHPQTVLSSVGK